MFAITIVSEYVNLRTPEIAMSPIEPMHVMLALPAVVGSLVAVVNSRGINAATDGAEAWIRARERDWHDADGKVRRYLLQPLLLSMTRFADWTDGIAHSGLKNGLRVTASLYAVVAWLLLMYVAVQVAVVVALTIIGLMAITYALSSGDESGAESTTASRVERVIALVPPGHRVDPTTGRIQKEGLVGWHDTDRRVDPMSGNVQREGFLGWADTGLRIDPTSGVVEDEGLLGYRAMEQRIDPEHGVIQEEGILGWRDTDERINPETGRRQRRGLFGWLDT